MEISLKMFLGIIVCIFIIIVSIIVCNVEVIYAFTLCIWILMIFFAYNKIKDRGMLFAFLISFFVFLLGRDFMEQFFGYKVEQFDTGVQHHAWISCSLSLLSIWVFYLYFEKKQRRQSKFESLHNISQQEEYVSSVKKMSKLLYYITWIFAFVYAAAISRFVSATSYYEYYTDFSEYLSGNTVLYIISKIQLMMPAALCCFLATNPSKKEATIPIAVYILYLVVSMGGGQRSTALLGVLFLFVYFVFRNGMDTKEKWITKPMIFIGLLSLPALAVLVSVVNVLREGGDVSSITLTSGIMNFFYDQGTTINAIKRAFMYKEEIPNQIYTLEFLHSGILARIFNIPIYHGNTIEHALYGGSFMHSLSYTVMGISYIAGRGTGSSYIAELYQDFGYFGIILGSILYAFMLSRITHRNTNSNLFINSLSLMIITQILWAPRGSFTSFISQNLTFTNIAVMIFVFGIPYLWMFSKGQYRRVKAE